MSSLFSGLSKKIHDYRLAQEAAEDAADAAAEQLRFHTIRGNTEGSPLQFYLNKQSQKNKIGGRTAGAQRTVKPVDVPRSVMFVPCHKPKALSKISKLEGEGAADVYILDLEDSVPPTQKQEARRTLADFVAGGGLSRTPTSDVDSEDVGAPRPRRAIVRINSLRTDPANAILDLETVLGLGSQIEGVGIPKVEVGDEVALAEYLQPLGKGTETTHQLWAFFETPRAILDADKICGTNFYSYGVMGLNDLGNELGLPLNLAGPRVQHYYSMSSVVIACRAHGMIPIDGVFNDPMDIQGLEAELAECRRFGFDGKTLIHPSQVETCNTAFVPTKEEVAWAERLLRAVRDAGNGVAVLDGKMVEELHARQAERMLARFAAHSQRVTAPPDGATPSS